MFIFLSLSLSARDPSEYLLYRSGDLGSKYYRIPAITRAKDGSLITSVDQRWNSNVDLPGKIYVLIKRSTDNGKTWSPAMTIAADDYGYGDASLVVDQKTGVVLCIFNAFNGIYKATLAHPMKQYYSRSYDNGKTWTEPVDFTMFTYGTACPDPVRSQWPGMFVSSGSAVQLRDGRIMVGAQAHRSASEGLTNYPVWTDDLGETWVVGGEVVYGGDESKIVELNNGSLLMSIRHTPNRWFAISNDRGETWNEHVNMEDIHDPACNGDIVRYTSTKDGFDKNRLIQSVPYSNTRSNVSVLISYDEGNTWPIKKVVHSEGSGYSSVAVTNDGEIAVFYERQYNDGYDLVVQMMDLEYVSDGSDKWQPPSK